MQNNPWNKTTLLTLGGVLLIVVAGFIVWYLGAQNSKQVINNEQSALANPASVNCIQKGGTLEIKTNEKGGQYGVCYFLDNRQCEEWALMSGECPVGGLKVTGYQTDAEVYCAITGGQLESLDTPTPMCKRVDGTLCNAQANLNGDCPDPNNPNPNAENTEI